MADNTTQVQLDHSAREEQMRKQGQAIMEKWNKAFEKRDNYWRVGGMSTLIFVIIFIYNVPAFREKAQSMNIHVITLSSLWSCLAGFMFQWMGRKYFYLLIKDFFSKHLHPKRQYQPQQKRKDKLITMTRQAFDTFYHLTVSVIYFWLFRSQSWFPTVAGGCGSCQNICKDYPNWPSNHTQFFQMYYLFQLGGYFYYIFEMVYLQRQRFQARNFGQLLYHHVITVMLILFSILYNYTHMGSLILFVHDASDAFRAFSRTIGESKLCITFPWLGVLTNYGYFISWIYMRLIIFPFCLIDSMYYSIPTGDHQWNISMMAISSLTVLTLAIFFLQCYWVLQIRRSIINEKMKNQLFIASQEKLKNTKTE